MELLTISDTILLNSDECPPNRPMSTRQQNHKNTSRNNNNEARTCRTNTHQHRASTITMNHTGTGYSRAHIKQQQMKHKQVCCSRPSHRRACNKQHTNNNTRKEAHQTAMKHTQVLFAPITARRTREHGVEEGQQSLVSAVLGLILLDQPLLLVHLQRAKTKTGTI